VVLVSGGWGDGLARYTVVSSAIHLPPGDQVGHDPDEEIRRALPPAAGITQTPFPRVRSNAISFPFGDHAGYLPTTRRRRCVPSALITKSRCPVVEAGVRSNTTHLPSGDYAARELVPSEETPSESVLTRDPSARATFSGPTGMSASAGPANSR
jgi:hypothetical protein